uniref:C1 family peptidase n=1 Tax=Methanobrevibacter sp. TaxID=66852 RepID=UPI00388DAFA4
MKKYKKYFIILLILSILLSITAVSANDNPNEVNTNQNLEMNIPNTDSLQETSEYKTYDDFYEDMKSCKGFFDIENNYKYDESDSKMDLSFNQTNLVINGNNHIIDGSNQAQGFTFINKNASITINDLTFINCNQSISFASGNIILNNVNFTNNFEKNSLNSPGIVLINQNGNLTLNHCNFNSNNNSTLISASFSNIAIYNSHFYNTKSINAPILVNRETLVIENSTFENLSSKYGGAINFKGDYLYIKNSTFKNIYADLTGGAILGKLTRISLDLDDPDSGMRPAKEWFIENCEFMNVSSIHNGGAIYFDLDSGAQGFKNTVHISNCDFSDISSGYGGIIADQGGILDISNSNFTNSKVSELGGAIYTSWADLTLTNCNIINNSAKSNAGAIYFDKGKLVIDKSNFVDNTVTASSSGKESVIYANDVTANINNSTFNNGGIAIYANFASDDSIIKDIISTDLFLLNNTDYIVSVENNGIKLNLTGNSIVADTLPARFDARDWGWASPLKYQGDNLACWAFATAGALECALLKQTGVLYNISEDNIQNLQLKYYSEGDTRNSAVGFAYSGLGHSLSWYGVITAQDDPYDERGMFSSVAQTENRIHLQDAMIIFGGRNDTMDLIKQAVINYGAVSVQYNYGAFDYNRTNFTDDELQPGHFITLIGWDDNYSAENFRGSDVIIGDVLPKGDGAWLIKDSENKDLNETEGTLMGEGGYMWLSYYNPSFLAKDFYAIIPQAAAIAYIFENDNDYHVNYQTDLTGLSGFDGDYTYYSNEFTSKYTESIGAVGTYFNESGIEYSFDVYVNGEKVHTQNGVSEFAGFRTIILNKYVPVKSNDTFKVVFKSNALPFQAYSRQ